MKRTLLIASLVVSAVALADGPAVTAAGAGKAPVLTAGFKLACPSGTSQVGSVGKSNMSMIACFKVGAEGSRQFQGPMITLLPTGKVESQGQYEAGLRSGKWEFFNEAGGKVGETEFKKGDYHGRRVIFFDNGSVKAEEFWVDGKRQGAQKSFDEGGKVTVQNFLDDRPVAAN